MVLLSLAGYAVSFSSQLIISYYFGTSATLDSYLSALTIINLLTFFAHPLREALVTELHKADKQGAQEQANAMFSSATLLLLGLSTATAIFALLAQDQITTLVASHADSLSRDNIKTALLWLLPSVWLFSFSETLNSLLTSYNRQVYQAIARLLGALATLDALAMLGGNAGVGALAVGLMSGQLVTVLLSATELYRCKIRFAPTHLNCLKGGSFFPVFSSLLVVYLISQMYSVTERNVMLGLSTGLVASFQYSVNLVNTMLSILAFPLINLLWPSFTGLDQSRLHSMVMRTSGILVISLCTVCAFTFIYAREIVELVYFRGAFNQESLLKTELALRCAIFAAVPGALYNLFVRVFLSAGASRLIAVAGIGSALTGVIVLFIARYSANPVLAQCHWLVANCAGLLFCWWGYSKKNQAVNRVGVAELFLALKILIAAVAPCIILPAFEVSGGSMTKIAMLSLAFALHGGSTLVLAFLLGVTGALGIRAPWQAQRNSN